MSIQTIQKQLKELDDGIALDITWYTDQQIRELREKEAYFNEVCYSKGLYGCNGLLLQGHNTKQLYKITQRTGAIFSI